MSTQIDVKVISEFKDENSFLSNDYLFDITLGNIVYPSLEHAYHSEKSELQSWKMYCSNKKTTIQKLREASMLIDLREDWRKIRLDLMAYLLIQKFESEEISKLLLNTYPNIILFANNNGDKYWGFCLKEKRGDNMIGNMIMQIRAKLKNK